MGFGRGMLTYFTYVDTGLAVGNVHEPESRACRDQGRRPQGLAGGIRMLILGGALPSAAQLPDR